MPNSKKPLDPRLPTKRGAMQYTGKSTYKDSQRPIKRTNSNNARYTPPVIKPEPLAKDTTNQSVDITPPKPFDMSHSEEIHPDVVEVEGTPMLQEEADAILKGYEEGITQRVDDHDEASTVTEDEELMKVDDTPITSDVASAEDKPAPVETEEVGDVAEDHAIESPDQLNSIDWTKVTEADPIDPNEEPPFTEEELEILDNPDKFIDNDKNTGFDEFEFFDEEKEEEEEEPYTPPPFVKDKFDIAQRVNNPNHEHTVLSIILDKWKEANEAIESAIANEDGIGVRNIASKLGVINYAGFKEEFTDELKTMGDNIVRTINKKFQGEIPLEAIDAIIGNTLGMGGRAVIWLPVLGVNVTVSAPPPVTYTTFWQQLDRVMTQKVISTYGVSYNTQVAPYAEALAELAIKHVSKISIDAPIEEVINYQTLTLPDLEVLLVGLMAARYTNGYEIDVSCITCSNDDRFNINLINTIKYKELPEILEHDCYKLRNADKKVSVDTWMNYRKMIAEITRTEYALTEILTAEWRLPTIAEYIDMADFQTRRIANILEDTVIESEENEEELVETITSMLTLTYMANHTSKIIVNQGPNEEPGLVSKREGIIKVYETLSTSSTISANAIEAAAKWAGDSLATAVIPKYRCSACMRDLKETEDNPITYTPIDVMSFFGLAMKNQIMAG